MSDQAGKRFAQFANMSEGFSLLLAKASSNALISQSKDDFFNTILRDLGKTLAAERAYIFNKKDGFWHNTYEWTAAGVEPQLPRLQYIEPSEVAWFVGRLEQGLPLCIDDVRQLQDESARDFLAAQGICSLLAAPIIHEGAVRGMFGFDICNRHVSWPEKVVNLAMAMQCVAGAEINLAQRRSLADKGRQLRDILDAFVEPVYIADMDSYEVLFANKALNDGYPLRTGKNMLCYARFQGLDAPCPFCSNSTLRLQETPYHWLHCNELTRRTYTVVDRAIRWEDGRRVRLSIAMDVTDVLGGPERKGAG